MTTGALEGKAALITGGGSGIGLQIARALVRDGATVTIAGRSVDRLAEAVASLEGDATGGATVHAVGCDVADEAQVAAAVAAAREPLGGLHIAVANAGRGGVSPILATPLEEWEGIMATNVTGTFLTFKHAGAEIVRSGGGAMLAMSSIAATATHRFMGPYCVSKAAIDMLVENTADELGMSGVRVNSVRPGLVDTELVAFPIADERILESYLAAMPISRVGETDDIANLVRFLVGPESGWITGTCVAADGGHHLRGGPDFEGIARALYGDDVCENRIPPPG